MLAIRKHLFTGGSLGETPGLLWSASLQDHMRASRKEMNQSYVNQQNQLMSMNVVREAQRLQLSQAETIVKLNQLKEEVIKALREPVGSRISSGYLPPKNVRVVVPTSNATLESTLDRDQISLGTPKVELEEKKPAPINTKSIPNLAAQVLASKGKPSAAKANSRASSAASSRTSSNYGSAPTSPSASEAPTVSTSTTAQSDQMSPSAISRKYADLRGKVMAKGKRDSEFRGSAEYNNAIKGNPTKIESQVRYIQKFETLLADEASGSGLKRAKNGRFTKR